MNQVSKQNVTKLIIFFTSLEIVQFEAQNLSSFPINYLYHVTELPIIGCVYSVHITNPPEQNFILSTYSLQSHLHLSKKTHEKSLTAIEVHFSYNVLVLGKETDSCILQEFVPLTCRMVEVCIKNFQEGVVTLP